MLVEKDGRTFSVRTSQELDTALQAELATLSPEEKEALNVVLAELRAKNNRRTKLKPGQKLQNPGLLDALSMTQYKHPPVDVRTFIKDPYYLGNTCDNLYPQYLDDLIELFEGGYNECIISGAIGIGKSFFCSIGICRILYEMSCLKDPHKTFGIAKDTNITVAAFSVNEELATKVVFENIKTKITASPYFQEHFNFEATKKELRFPHNIWVAPRATTDTSALGLNVISAFMDEGNFLPKRGKHADAGIVDHADVIYSSLKRRMKSRFERKGKLPSILFIASSKTTSEDFVSRRLREAKDDPTVFARDYALWDVKRDNYSHKCFQVLVGNESAPSKILETGEADKLRPSLPEGALIIDVPEDFKHDFESNLEGSIKDLAGISVVSVSPFIQRREKLADANAQDAAMYGPNRHPFSAEEYDSSRGGMFLWDRMVQPVREQMMPGAYADTFRPIINPHASRHVHIDIGIRHDALGFCMAHVSGYKDVVRRGPQGEHLERAPIYTVDVALRVVPPPGDEIILGDVRRLIYELSAHGYSITTVSTDSFQSTDMIQQLNAKGFNAKLVSVDTSTDPYENLKTAFYEDRVFLYDYPKLMQELRQLQRDYIKKKVDHPVRGCFTGDTKVLLSDGSSVRFDALLGNPTVGVVTYDGTPLPATALNPRETMLTSELVEIELENGESVRCTPDHRFLLKDGTYKEAQHLTPEDDLQCWY